MNIVEEGNMSEFVYSNVAKEIEYHGFDSVVKSHCRMCHGGCGVLVYTKKGKVAKIAGDPGCPINHGTICSKAMASAQLAYHPDRLTHPVENGKEFPGIRHLTSLPKKYWNLRKAMAPSR
jgi:anaerobic selenocysteine-containing dehydrogenase